MVTLNPQQVYSWRAYKHKLTERVPRKQLSDVVAVVGGLQAQVMSAAVLQAWARVDGITQQDIRDALWQEHSLVKTWAWRGTLHLLASSEFPTYVAALSTRSRHLSNAWLTYFHLTKEEMIAVQDAIVEALDGRNLTREELASEVARITGHEHLREEMLSGWGSMLKPSAFHGNLCFGPSQGQTVTFVRPDQWIGDFPREDPQEALKTLCKRYLSTYGPASRDDFARWFGMNPPEAGRILKALGDEIEPVSVDAWEGWKGWAMTGDIKKIASLSANSSVRLLPNFDPYVVARTHAAKHDVPNHEVNLARIHRVAGWVTPVVLVDGRIEGIWEYEKRRNALAVSLEMFGALPKKVKQAIEEEVDRLGTFMGAQAELQLGKLDK